MDITRQRGRGTAYPHLSRRTFFFSCLCITPHLSVSSVRVCKHISFYRIRVLHVRGGIMARWLGSDGWALLSSHICAHIWREGSERYGRDASSIRLRALLRSCGIFIAAGCAAATRGALESAVRRNFHCAHLCGGGHRQGAWHWRQCGGSGCSAIGMFSAPRSSCSRSGVLVGWARVGGRPASDAAAFAFVDGLRTSSASRAGANSISTSAGAGALAAPARMADVANAAVCAVVAHLSFCGMCDDQWRNGLNGRKSCCISRRYISSRRKDGGRRAVMVWAKMK